MQLQPTRSRRRHSSALVVRTEHAESDAELDSIMGRCGQLLASCVDMLEGLERHMKRDPETTSRQRYVVGSLKGSLEYMLDVQRRAAQGDDEAFPEMMRSIEWFVGDGIAMRIGWVDPPSAPAPASWRSRLAWNLCLSGAMVGLWSWSPRCAVAAALLMLLWYCRRSYSCWRYR